MRESKLRTAAVAVTCNYSWGDERNDEELSAYFQASAQRKGISKDNGSDFREMGSRSAILCSPAVL